jgi:transcriptional regulator GlxA family with amidase domain
MHSAAEQIFREIGNAYFEFGEVRELMIYSLLLKFFTAYGSYRLPLIRDRQDLSAKRRQTNYDKIESAMNYVNENYREDLRVELMADRAHISCFHFARLFKEYANVTFHEYLTRRRVEEATSLLTESGKYITDIAFQAGFPSISAFNRSFKKYTNRTPREYKREASS